MSIREALLKEHSKAQTNRIVNYIGDDEKKFAELMDLFFNDEYRVVQRSAWSVSNCAEAHPQLIMPYLKKMIELLGEDVHNAVKRNIVRVLQFIDIPKKHYGKAAQACFDLLLSKDEPVAVKVFAMTVIANISKHEPDLKNELRIIINDQLPYSSAGFKSRAKKILMAIQN
ncbi:MAG: hypothetical protein ABI723_23725 [Bacteroidia bacterium]